MAFNAETLAIAQALLALSAAVLETQEALLLLAPPESAEFAKHLDAFNAAKDRYLEHIKTLVELADKGRE